jgi:hypothetical protein
VLAALSLGSKFPIQFDKGPYGHQSLSGQESEEDSSESSKQIAFRLQQAERNIPAELAQFLFRISEVFFSVKYPRTGSSQ